MIVALLDGHLERAQAGARAACPECKNAVYARTPEHAIRHWAHMPLEHGEVRSCSLDSGEMTEWHREWQSLREDPECIEVSRGDHRADAINEAGTVIEFQHSSISIEDVQARERFWGRGVWVLDGTPNDDGQRVAIRRRPEQLESDPYRSFKWSRALAVLYRAKWPCWIDVGGTLLQVRSAAQGLGNGWIVPTEWFVKEVLNGTRSVLRPHKLPGTVAPAKRVGHARAETDADLIPLIRDCARPTLEDLDEYQPVIPTNAASLGLLAPPRPRVIARRCSAGRQPCGAEARLYPCGWRCDEHRPGGSN